MTRLKNLTYRTLLVRTVKMAGTQWISSVIGGPSNIPLPAIYQIFDRVTSHPGQTVPLDLDEVECILANLICDGYIQGKILHDTRTLQIDTLIHK